MEEKETLLRTYTGYVEQHEGFSLRFTDCRFGNHVKGNFLSRVGLDQESLH